MPVSPSIVTHRNVRSAPLLEGGQRRVELGIAADQRQLKRAELGPDERTTR